MTNLEGHRDLLNRYIETISMVTHSTKYKTGTGAQGAGIRQIQAAKKKRVQDQRFFFRHLECLMSPN